jgi:hypothetical protein
MELKIGVMERNSKFEDWVPHYQSSGPLGWILAAFWQQITPTWPFLPFVPVCKYFAVYYLRLNPLHGMEEVVSSILTRSTKYPLLKSDT